MVPDPERKRMITQNILGIPFDALTPSQAMECLTQYLYGDKNRIVVTPNPEAVMQARRDPVFREALLTADMRLPDGIGIILASRILRGAIKERVRGLDTAYSLLRYISDKPYSVYFLGAAPGVAEKAANRMRESYPGLKVSGWHDGYFNANEEKLILAEISALMPDILLLGMGNPKQELWAYENRSIPVKVTLCCGGTLDIMSGQVKLTPAWLRRIGLEWLHRLITQPRRAKRMLDLPRFIFAVVKEAFTCA